MTREPAQVRADIGARLLLLDDEDLGAVDRIVVAFLEMAYKQRLRCATCLDTIVDGDCGCTKCLPAIGVRT